MHVKSGASSIDQETLKPFVALLSEHETAIEALEKETKDMMRTTDKLDQIRQERA